MYNGNETLIYDGVYLSNSMLDFWRWALPDLTDSTVRGTFAEFIVKTALDAGGVNTNSQMRGWAEYDLDGPQIPSVHKTAHIEIKCTSFIRPRGTKTIDRANFSIARAKMLDPIKQDYLENSPRQRNNDLYVFCVYTATSEKSNILDLTWWEFYVLPTHQIEKDDKLRDQKSISLKKVRELCKPLTYAQLCPEIIRVCNAITPEDMQRSQTD